jgi:hypothetical protein
VEGVKAIPNPAEKSQQSQSCGGELHVGCSAAHHQVAAQALIAELLRWTQRKSGGVPTAIPPAPPAAHSPPAECQSPRSLSKPGTGPEAFGLVVTNDDAEHLAVAEEINTEHHHHHLRHDLQVAAKSAVNVHRSKIDVRGMRMVGQQARED